jgi:hypothetical protein
MRTNASNLARVAVMSGAASLALCAGNSYAVFFDLRGLNPSESYVYHLSTAGIGVRVSADGGTVLMRSSEVDPIGWTADRVE